MPPVAPTPAGARGAFGVAPAADALRSSFPSLAAIRAQHAAEAKNDGRIVVHHVAVEISADTETPVSAYLKIAAHEPRTFLFESAEGGERVGRFSFLGAKPKTARSFSRENKADPLDYVDAYLARHQVVRAPGLPRFTGGLVGFVAFEHVARIERRLSFPLPDEHGFPEATWMDFDCIVAFDNLKHSLTVVAQIRVRSAAELPREHEAALAKIASVLRSLDDAPRVPSHSARSNPASIRLQPRTRRADFLSSVRRAKAHIRNGDCQQVVLSQRFDAATDASPLSMYRALRRINPSPYLFLVTDGERALVGSSPETLVRVTPRIDDAAEVTVRPIAGTRRRGVNDLEDERLARELLGDEKENAEHMMLVDLGRNDVGRVAEVGSVHVTKLRSVERYSHVMHMVSEVRGRLRPELSAIDALRASFPAGTVSGSPKVRAIEIATSLEPAARGPYAGAVGYVDAAGQLELAIAIRTLQRTRGRVSVQAGAGIVFDSSPTSELEETVHKASALFKAVQHA